MVVIPSSSGRENNEIDHTFAIASNETTVADFLKCHEQHEWDEARTPSSDCSINSATWYDAVAYCNWLNEKENIPRDHWIYEHNKNGKYADGMTIKENYLKLNGYRLPSEAEWETACRAGSTGDYFFGNSVLLLDRYANSSSNSEGLCRSVGALLPNSFGLFDVHGNVWEWVQDPESVVPSPVTADVRRVLRGGSYTNIAWHLRSAHRFSARPSLRADIMGFRVARTLPSASFTSLPLTAEGGRK